MTWDDLREHIFDDRLEIGYSRYAPTDFGDDDMPKLKSQTQLKHLGIWGTNITSRALEYLRPLQQLESLELSGQDNGLSALPPLPNVREVKLGFSHLTAEGLSALQGLTCLERLALIRCRIDDGALPLFAELRNLKGLSLHECNLDDGKLALLKLPAVLSDLVLSQGIYESESMFTSDGILKIDNLQSLSNVYVPLWVRTRVDPTRLCQLESTSSNCKVSLDVNASPQWAAEPEACDS